MMNKYERRILTAEETERVAGGHPFEESFADENLYRAGVSFTNTIFGSDEFRIGSTGISKDLARALRSRSSTLWKKNYAANADLVGYIREWKGVLANEYGISWNGVLGTYKVSLT